VNQAVIACALAVALLNALPALVGTWSWYRGEAAADQRSTSGSARAFWVLLRVGQGAALVLAVVVGSLAAAGHYSSVHLFYLYALLPLAVAFVAEQLRVASAQTILDQRDLPDAQAVGALPEAEQRAIVAAIVSREMIIMALSAFVVVFLALRAASTAHGF
jgi:1,4-dihydroxy-2-naphthoate octaprenyltransferase